MSEQSKYGIIGTSEEIQEVITTIEQVAPSNISVLIQGESGTGKELVAKAIHHLSPRRTQPYIVVNCGAIPSGTLDSELFGHRKGSFTGAYEDRQGFFEAADKGTIFLDEIGETPVETQVKLLRALEQGEIIRVGDNSTRKVDVRVIAATNRDLSAEVQSSHFRKDLFYRLKTITITIPPLHKRKEDIPLLANYFMTEFSDRNNMPYKPISPAAMKLLLEYHWEGNVRELRNFIQSVCVMEREKIIQAETVLRQLESETSYRQIPSADPRFPVKLHNKDVDQVERELILRQLFILRQDVEDVKQFLQNQTERLPNDQLNDISNMINMMKHSGNDEISSAEIANEERSISDVEKELIIKTLEKYFGYKRKAAKVLGISERTLYRKIKEYDIDSSLYK